MIGRKKRKHLTKEVKTTILVVLKRTMEWVFFNVCNKIRSDKLHRSFRFRKILKANRLNSKCNLNDYVKVSEEISAEAFFLTVKTLLRFAVIITLVQQRDLQPSAFSALNGLKTWLCSTVRQERLNCCVVAHIHKDMLREISG